MTLLRTKQLLLDDAGVAGESFEINNGAGYDDEATSLVTDNWQGGRPMVGGVYEHDTEELLITAASNTGDREWTLTVERGVNGTTAVALSDDDEFTLTRASRDATDDLATHEADTTNPHSTDIGNLGSGTLSELNSAVSDATLDDASDTRDPTAHASDHKTGGSDEIDGDNLDIDWDPSNYTPDESVTEADGPDALAAHLKGIDDALAAVDKAVMTEQQENPTQTIEEGGSGATGITMDADAEGSVMVFVNGQKKRVGDGVKTTPFWFEPSGGGSARSFGSIVQNDELRYSGENGQGPLNTSDEVDVVYDE